MPARDTDAEAHRVQIDVYRRMTPAERIALAFELSERARAVALEGIRLRNPELSAEAARHVLLRRLLGAELHRAAYPEAPPIDARVLESESDVNR